VNFEHVKEAIPTAKCGKLDSFAGHIPLTQTRLIPLDLMPLLSPKFAKISNVEYSTLISTQLSEIEPSAYSRLCGTVLGMFQASLRIVVL
jgi:hypothetical protein